MMAEVVEVEHEEQNLEKYVKKKGKHDKPKPWDDDPNIDRWTIEKFDPAWNPTGMLEVSSFATLFPQYREKYLQECWPRVASALKEYGVDCKLNLVRPPILCRVEISVWFCCFGLFVHLFCGCNGRLKVL